MLASKCCTSEPHYKLLMDSFFSRISLWNCYLASLWLFLLEAVLLRTCRANGHGVVGLTVKWAGRASSLCAFRSAPENWNLERSDWGLECHSFCQEWIIPVCLRLWHSLCPLLFSSPSLWSELSSSNMLALYWRQPGSVIVTYSQRTPNKLPPILYSQSIPRLCLH